MLIKDGVKGLYRGFVIANVGMVPYLATSFATYDTLKTVFPEENTPATTLDKVARSIGIGTLSGMTASLLTYPLDTIK